MSDESAEASAAPKLTKKQRRKAAQRKQLLMFLGVIVLVAVVAGAVLGIQKYMDSRDGTKPADLRFTAVSADGEETELAPWSIWADGDERTNDEDPSTLDIPADGEITLKLPSDVYDHDWTLLQVYDDEGANSSSSYAANEAKEVTIEGSSSLTDDEGNAYRDIRFEYYFPLAKYHSRWSALGDGDFHPRHTREKGGELAIGVATPRDYDITDSSGDEYGIGFQYLRRLIEECQRRGVEVLLTHLPYPATDEEQVVANTVRYIADEYGVNYIDFVSLDQVVDYETDCFDFNSHQNASGAQKITDYLGRYIRDHYDLPDHSGDADWAAGYNAYYEEKLGHLRAECNPASALMLLHDRSLSAVIAFSEDSAVYADEKLMRLVHNAAREHIYEEDAYAKWSSALFPLDGLEDAAYDGEACLIVLDRGSGVITQVPGGSAELETSFGALCASMEGGALTLTLSREGGPAFTLDDSPCHDVRILVIDGRTGDVAASPAFDL